MLTLILNMIIERFVVFLVSLYRICVGQIMVKIHNYKFYVFNLILCYHLSFNGNGTGNNYFLK